MLKKVFEGGADAYVAPEIVSTEISVEKGFAGSGFGDPGAPGDDRSSYGYEY